MKKLAGIFLFVFVSIFIFRFNVNPKDNDVSKVETDKLCREKQVKVFSPDPSDYKQIPQEKALQAGINISENHYVHDLKTHNNKNAVNSNQQQMEEKEAGYEK